MDRIFKECQIVVHEDEPPLMGGEWDNPYTMTITDESGETVNVPINKESYEKIQPIFD